VQFATPELNKSIVMEHCPKSVSFWNLQFGLARSCPDVESYILSFTQHGTYLLLVQPNTISSTANASASAILFAFAIVIPASKPFS
jgi:hypothetical protein